MDLFRYAPGGGNPLLGGGGGKGALMGVAPNVFWLFVAAAAIFIVLHAAYQAASKARGGKAVH